MEHTTADDQPARRERIGGHAWVRTVGLVGSGLVAGGILAGTMTATAAEETATPETSQEQATVAPEDCPEGAGGSVLPGGGTDAVTPESSASSAA
ncbi:hypothetical protein [Blastococcus sp. SYSU DS0533]